MIRYFLFGAAAVAAMGWVAITRHRPPPLPSPAEVREERAYGKGDLLFVHRDPPPLPSPLVPVAPPVVVDAEPPPPPPKKREEKKRMNICERTGGVKIDTGRSWHCRYSRRR
jgi:hypothetical protein